MKVVVDTTIWSLALRRRSTDRAAHVRRLLAEWTELVKEGRGGLLGIVRQEVLSRIPDGAAARRLGDIHRTFPDVAVGTSDHEAAAEGLNRCRAKGVTGSPADFSICAVAIRLEVPVFTTDADFAGHARRLPFRLHAMRAGLAPLARRVKRTPRSVRGR